MGRAVVQAARALRCPGLGPSPAATAVRPIRPPPRAGRPLPRNPRKVPEAPSPLTSLPAGPALLGQSRATASRRGHRPEGCLRVPVERARLRKQTGLARRLERGLAGGWKEVRSVARAANKALSGAPSPRGDPGPAPLSRGAPGPGLGAGHAATRAHTRASAAARAWALLGPRRPSPRPAPKARRTARPAVKPRAATKTTRARLRRRLPANVRQETG